MKTGFCIIKEFSELLGLDRDKIKDSLMFETVPAFYFKFIKNISCISELSKDKEFKTHKQLLKFYKHIEIALYILICLLKIMIAL